ncbi:MAG: class II fructose-bisphosphate aldolase [Chloroflexota bacterium]|nr:class II fructose-bisphosphate aldolase [Chloroflexota bacterium]
MTICQSAEELLDSMGGIIRLENGGVEVGDGERLQGPATDDLVYNAVFANDEVKALARWLIRETGQRLGIRPGSINSLYLARGRGDTEGQWTVPAMNLRGMAYDMARAVFQAALPRDVGAMIFEIARSEMGYTGQPPAEYASVVLAAAIREGYRGPLFIQGDHFQVNPGKYTERIETELDALESLIQQSIEAGFYNIDIDTSTLVDLSQPTTTEQQRTNFELCGRFTKVIRELEPEGITISVGGEIGEIGGKNSTPEELRAFMDGYNDQLPEGMMGLSKISIQTGTSHGGVVLPDGSLAQVKIDFNVLRRLSDIARNEYGMGGAVQHGASTLPEAAFHKFPAEGCLEIHLATGFQNIIYEHPEFPADLREEIYDYLKEEHAHRWKDGQTEEQFIYDNRKRAFGPFKKEVWDIEPGVREEIREALEEKFAFLFEQLDAVDTVRLVDAHVDAPEVHKERGDLVSRGETAVDAELAD